MKPCSWKGKKTHIRRESTQQAQNYCNSLFRRKGKRLFVEHERIVCKVKKKPKLNRERYFTKNYKSRICVEFSFLHWWRYFSHVLHPTNTFRSIQQELITFFCINKINADFVFVTKKYKQLKIVQLKLEIKWILKHWNLHFVLL